MHPYARLPRFRKAVAILTFGAAAMFPFGSCDLGEFTTTTTTTISGRDAVLFLVRSLIFNPIEEFITDRIDDLIGEEEA